MHDVINEIMEENKWRELEFAKIKKNSSQVEESLWCRMCVPMIYAHWEGYVISAVRILLRYLNSLSLSPNEVTTHLIVTALEDSYKTLSGNLSFQSRVKFTRNFREQLGGKLVFGKKIDTKSNLTIEMLGEICARFQIDLKKFDDVSRDINYLVSARNAIAHGENARIINREKVNELIEIATRAFDILLTEIDEYLQNEMYKNNTVHM